MATTTVNYEPRVMNASINEDGSANITVTNMVQNPTNPDAPPRPLSGASFQLRSDGKLYNMNGDSSPAPQTFIDATNAYLEACRQLVAAEIAAGRHTL